MIVVMGLIQTTAELTDGLMAASRTAMENQDHAAAPVRGRVFNRVIDRSQKGIDYARGGVELDAISQVFCTDISSSMTAASFGALEPAMGLPGHLIDEVNPILCLQNTVIAPPAHTNGLKRMSILRKRPDVSFEDFQDQWFNWHSLLVKRLPGIAGYRQNLVLDGPRDVEGHYMVDGMVELWFPDAATIEANFRSDVGITLMTHAKEFISEISTFLVEPTHLSGAY